MIPVGVPCLCPGGDHPDGDTVYLRERLDFRAAVTMQKTIITLRSEVEDPSVEEILAALTEAYVIHGIVEWTLVKDGNPIPVDRESITAYLLSNLPAALTVADKADDLYQETVLLPLLQRGSTSSGSSPTTGSTSPTTSSPDEPPTLLRPSSTFTSRTDSTGMTSESPGGDSNSSPILASAG